MATMSITSNDGVPAHRQARAAGPRRSESMTQIPTSSSLRVTKWRYTAIVSNPELPALRPLICSASD
jgi:hypothetical protein